MDSSDTIQDALDELSRGNPEKATLLIQAISELDPSYPQAVYLRGLIKVFTQTDTEQGLRLMIDSVELGLDDPNVFQNIGNQLFQKGEYEKAISYLLRMDGQDGHNNESYFLLCCCYYLLGDLDGISRFIGKVSEFDDQLCANCFLISRCYALTGIKAKAAAYIDRAHQLEPAMPKVYEHFIRWFLRENNYMLAADLLELAIGKLGPANIYYTALIDCYLELNNTDAVIDTGKAAVAAHCQGKTILPLLMYQLIESERHEELFSYQWLALDGDNGVKFELIQFILKQLIATGRFPEILPYARAVHEHFPAEIFASNAMAVVLLSLGQHEESKIYLKQALAMDPMDEYANTNMAAALLQQEQYGEAIPYLEQSRKLLPDEVVYATDLALCYRFTGNSEKEAQIFTELEQRQLLPQQHYVSLSLQQFFRSGDQRTAFETIRRGIAKFPANVELRCYLSSFLTEIGEREQAIEVLQEAVAIDPSSEMAHAWLGKNYMLAGLPGAEQHFQTAIRLNPVSLYGWGGLSDIASEQHHYQKAAELLGNVASDKRDNAEWLLRMVRLPALLNPDQNLHYLQYLFQAGYYSTLNRRFCLETAVRLDLPMMVEHLTLTTHFTKKPMLMPLAAQLAEAKNIVRPFKKLIQLWQQTIESPAALMAEAIISQQLGDPIRAYHLYNGKLPKNYLFESQFHYYQCLSASQSIGKGRPLEEAMEFTREENGRSLRERYYSALILRDCNQYERAISILSAIQDAYRPARYALALIYKMLAGSSQTLSSPQAQKEATETYASLLAKLLLQEKANPFYHLGIRPAIVGEDPQSFLEAIAPVLHFIENRDIIAELMPMPVEMDHPFAVLVQTPFQHSSPGYSLEKKLPQTWKKLVATGISQRELELTTNSISAMKELACDAFANMVLKGTKAELRDISGKVTSPGEFQFRLYFAVLCELYDRGDFDFEQTMDLANYSCYCLEQLPALKNNELSNFLTETFVELLIDSANIPYIFWLQKIAKLNTILRERQQTRKSDLLSYADYKWEMARVSAPAASD